MDKIEREKLLSYFEIKNKLKYQILMANDLLKVFKNVDDEMIHYTNGKIQAYYNVLNLIQSKIDYIRGVADESEGSTEENS